MCGAARKIHLLQRRKWESQGRSESAERMHNLLVLEFLLLFNKIKQRRPSNRGWADDPMKELEAGTSIR